MKRYEITTEFVLGFPYDLVEVEHRYKIGDIVTQLPDGIFIREGDDMMQILRSTDYREVKDET